MKTRGAQSSVAAMQSCTAADQHERGSAASCWNKLTVRRWQRVLWHHAVFSYWIRNIIPPHGLLWWFNCIYKKGDWRVEREIRCCFNSSLHLTTTHCNPDDVGDSCGAVISFWVPCLFSLISTETFLKLHFSPFFTLFSLIFCFTSS